MSRSLVVVFAIAVMTFSVGQTAARAETPPPTGCAPWMVAPTYAATCDGTIVWGAQHGVARVHSIVWVDAPRVAEGMTVTYTWKVGGTYYSGHRYYGIGWSAAGKNLSVKVLVKTYHGGFAKYYYFGVVRPAA